MIVYELYLKAVVFDFLKVFGFSKVKSVYHPLAWWWVENKDWIAVPTTLVVVVLVLEGADNPALSTLGIG
jgi:hypothetical protein